MFPSKVPRVFVLASAVLLFLVTYTTLHLYHRVPPSYPAADPQILPIKEAITPEGQADANHVVVADITTDILPPTIITPTPSPTSKDEEPAWKPKTDNALSQPSAQPTIFSDDTAAGDKSGEEEHQQPLPDPKLCSKELEFLVRSSIDLELTERVHYVRRYIKPIFSDTVDRDDIVNITEPLVKGEKEIDLYQCGDVIIPQSEPIKLVVPKPHPKTTFSHLMFGVATDYKRLNDSIIPFTHWISGTGAKLVSVVTDAKEKSPEDIKRLQRSFEIADIDVTLVKPISGDFSTSQNHFAVLINMLQQDSPDTQWYGLIDDDTFFPDLKPLSDSLATLDHKTDAYVGALSEDFQSVRSFGFMAFGGAGAFLSAPLARKLSDQALQCIHDATTIEGDTILRDCVYSNSKAKLTILPGLYQQDLRDDASGFFEAGLKPLNLHHWKSWYKAPVEKMAKAAKLCGDCFLQRWRFGNDTVFSNGFSIVEYPDGVESVNLQLMEGTWGKADSRDFDFSLGPLRQPYPADQKKSYKLRGAEFTESGDLRQLYVRVADASKDEDELDQAIELIWQRH
ncbi:glycosyltransferase family 31 protein [Daldinia loculata]|uniref:glycosyltransferase family 31 protein n=1 Tax=Daldinia loculata TaxID=103429 RepID=UPI0020C48B1A|nr:glycosyltransferase family 31 protein [Daldinia loculata]KAI1643243.1 glycosyltransferase family 31 protein [Daldinia loculata]